jgi:hypothetical protein
MGLEDAHLFHRQDCVEYLIKPGVVKRRHGEVERI